MSYFIYGSFEIPGGGKSAELAARLRELARKQGLELASEAVLQRSVVESVLLDRSLTGDDRLPFLLVQTAGEDTSDNLISPFAVISRAERLASAERIGRFMEAVGRAGVEGFDLLVSEGYDVAFTDFVAVWSGARRAVEAVLLLSEDESVHLRVG
ncbi:MAG: hypothetical protein AAF481_00765 [Acidobacteriota bacterium]